MCKLELDKLDRARQGGLFSNDHQRCYLDEFQRFYILTIRVELILGNQCQNGRFSWFFSVIRPLVIVTISERPFLPK